MTLYEIFAQEEQETMARKKKPQAPTHEPGDPWSREKVQAFIDHYGDAVAAAEAAGVSRQAFHQTALRYGVQLPEAPTVNPAEQPVNAGRKNPTVNVALRPEHHAWIAEQGPKKRSALVQRGLDYLSAPDRAAWLAEHEDRATLDRAAALARKP